MDHDAREANLRTPPPERRSAKSGPLDDAISEDDDFDLRGLLFTLWRGKWIIGVCAVIAAGLSVVAVSQMEPTYTATARVLFNPARANVIEMQDVMAPPDIRSDGLQNEIEVLRSTSLLSAVVEELDLGADPHFNPALRDETTLLADAGRWLNPLNWIPDGVLRDLGLMSPPPPPPAPEEAARRMRLAMVDRLDAELRLRPIQGSRVLELAYTAGHPNLAALIVNTLAEQYIVEQLEAKQEAASEATDWLSERIDELRDRVQSAEEAVERTRADLTEAYGQSSEVLYQQLTDLNLQLAEVRGLRSDLEARFARVSSQLRTEGDLGAVLDFRESPEIQQLRDRERELHNREDELLVSVSETHPAVQQVRDQIAEVRDEIRAEAERVAAALEAEIEIIRDREASLARQVGELEAETVDQSRLELQLRELDREAQASRTVYENFLARYNELAQQAEVQQPDARILSPAEPPLAPDAEGKRRTVVASTMGGGLLGIALVFLLNRLNNTFRGQPQLEEATALPVIATLPLIKSRRRDDVVKQFREKPNSALAEAVRNLRTSVMLSSRMRKVCMIASAVPAEGKSTTSMLLALTTVATGKSAIIVDCDLRRPSLAALIEQTDDQAPGLFSLLESKASLDEVISVEPETGLHILSGRTSEYRAGGNAADILASGKFHQTIEELKTRYDVVILDTPPVLAVTDARIIAALADVVVFAVRWDSTPREAVKEGVRELYSVDAPLIGTVMTMVNQAKASSYNYGGYKYSSRYHSYYLDA